MDWDDIGRAKAPDRIVVGETLERHSVAELEQRIKALDGEIDRVRLELEVKRAHEARAQSVFKSS